MNEARHVGHYCVLKNNKLSRNYKWFAVNWAAVETMHGNWSE